MKSAIITEPNNIKIECEEIPSLKEDEALLKILYCGICGADLASYTGNQPFTTYPRIPGHEFSAEIVEIKNNGYGLKKGDIVTANPYFNCGFCYSCERGYVNCCVDNKTMGVQRNGSFSEYIAMPVKRIYHGMGLNPKLLALIEPFAIGYHAVSRGTIKKTDKILIIGAGPIGIFALISAKMTGAKVYMADLLDGRLNMSKEFGADGTVNTGAQSLKEFTGEVTGGNGFDVCIEACGLPQTFLDCIENAAFRANIILIGNGKRETVFNHSVLLKKELNIYGSRNSYAEDFKNLIDIVKKGDIDLSKVISEVYPFSETKEAFEALRNNNGSINKILVEINT